MWFPGAGVANFPRLAAKLHEIAQQESDGTDAA
jgi:hypothetical protein